MLHHQQFLHGGQEGKETDFLVMIVCVLIKGFCKRIFCVISECKRPRGGGCEFR